MENLILSIDGDASTTISSPEFERRLTASDTETISLRSDAITSEQIMGLGITYYFMPKNVFISGTLGFGAVRTEGIMFSGIPNSSFSDSSDYGMAVKVKAGKEWWVSKNWGLGVSVGMAYCRADDKPDPLFPSYKGTYSTKKLFVMFNTTFN